MKQLLALLLALALFAVACGGSDSDSETADTGDADTAQAADSSDDDGDDATDDEDAMDDDAMGDCAFDAPDEINVAYFEEWPTANQVAQADGTYDERLCATVNWLPFPSGNEMSLAMESGDVDISYSQGLTPFANAVTSGADLEMVGVAVAYADADQCIVHPDYDITKDNASDFEGQAVYSPIGNVTHFQLLTQLDALGVDIPSVNIIPSEGGAAAVAAFESGDVAMACAFGGSVLAMLELGGTPLSTVEEKLAMGIRVFDIISIPTSFGEEYPGAVTEFLQVTEDANGAFATDRASAEPIIADTAGMDLEASNALLDQFIFYDADTQLSDAWMGGVAQDVMLEQMQFFQEQGEIDDALGDYSGFVNTSFLQEVE